MGPLEAKICAIIALGLSTLVAGFIPVWFSMRGWQQKPLLVSSLLCFGGGVLLATALIHMLPEFRQSFKKYESFTELIFCAGFFVIFLIDEVIHFFIGDSHSHDSIRNTDPSSSGEGQIKLNDSESKIGERQEPQYGAIEVNPLLHNRRQSNLESNAWDETPSQLCHVTNKEPCAALPVGNLSLLVALTVHALLEGLPIGIQNSTSKVFLLLGAIASHKLIVAFCLGVELVSVTTTTIGHFIYIFVFAFGSLLGIFTGMAITKIPEDISLILFPVLKGLTGGTLLYVTVCEILPRERARWHKQHTQRVAGIVQFLSVGMGFVLMATLTKCLD